jgi:hypothetical protein
MKLKSCFAIGLLCFAEGCGGGGGITGGTGGTGGGGSSFWGSGGSGADGSEVIAEGPRGTVGNRCTEDGACETDLVCAASDYCQPAETILPAEIVQAVPTPDSAKIPAYAPIVLFADSTYTGTAFTIEAHTLSGTVDVTDQVTVTTLTSGAGKDVYLLAPQDGFPLGSSIVVSISGPFTGTVVFNVDHASPAFAEGALDFETSANPATACSSSATATSALPVGWSGFGDFGMIGATGSIQPTSGSSTLALTTGSVLCGSALDGTSSMAISGPIQGFGDSPSFQFDYNFQSAEFDDFCNSSFDDTLLAVLSGPNGAVAEVVNSVNLTCAAATQVDATFPSMPDDGDEVYRETGNTTFTLSGNVGSPAVLSFVVTDVSDAAFSSVVSIDNIRGL